MRNVRVIIDFEDDDGPPRSWHRYERTRELTSAAVEAIEVLLNQELLEGEERPRGREVRDDGQ